MTGRLKTKITIIAIFVAIFWTVEILNQFVFDHQLNQYDIIPSSLPFGLRWILFAPFLHDSFKDLIIGTIGFVILGFSVLNYKIRHFWIVTIITMIVGGLGIWRFSPYDPHPIGTSILIFGYLAFLLCLVGAESDSTGKELRLSALHQPVDERNLLDSFIMHSLTLILGIQTLILALPGYVLYGLSTIGIHNLFGVPAHIASGFFAGTIAADLILQDKGRATRWKLFWISFPLVFIISLFVSNIYTILSIILFYLVMIVGGVIAFLLILHGSESINSRSITSSRPTDYDLQESVRRSNEKWAEREQERQREEQQRQNNEDR